MATADSRSAQSGALVPASSPLDLWLANIKCVCAPACEPARLAHSSDTQIGDKGSGHTHIRRARAHTHMTYTYRTLQHPHNIHTTHTFGTHALQGTCPSWKHESASPALHALAQRSCVVEGEGRLRVQGCGLRVKG